MAGDGSEKTPLLVTLVFYALGMATLLPWNFFITAETYWQYKLRNVSLGEAWAASNATLTPLQISFTPTLVIVSNVFCTVFLLFTSAIVRRVREMVRQLGSLVLSLATMVLITLFTFIDTDSWQFAFFVVTMILIAILNVCVAVLQGSSYGLAGLFPSACMSGMLSGQAISGIFSSLARIISLLVGEEPVASGLVFFLIADGFLVLSIVGYVCMTRTDYYHLVKAEAEMKEQEEAKGDMQTYVAVLKKIWLMGTTLGGTLFITLMVYPAVVVYVTSVFPASRWTDEFFQPTITFLLFNVGDTLGREVTRWLRWPRARGWQLHVFGAARLVFLPLLMLCHGENKTFPTLLDHDAYYIVLIFLFAFTNGYVGTLTMIYYPSLVEPSELEVGGAIMAAMMGIGMVLGSLLSPAFVALWGPV